MMTESVYLYQWRNQKCIEMCRSRPPLAPIELLVNPPLPLRFDPGLSGLFSDEATRAEDYSIRMIGSADRDSSSRGRVPRREVDHGKLESRIMSSEMGFREMATRHGIVALLRIPGFIQFIAKDRREAGGCGFLCFCDVLILLIALIYCR